MGYTYKIWDKKSDINGISPEVVVAEYNLSGDAFLVYQDDTLMYFQATNPFNKEIESMTVEQAEEAAQKFIEMLIVRDNDNDVSEDKLREMKCIEISDACQEAILSGIDIKLADETKHFSLSIIDQVNLTNLMLMLEKNGSTGVPYHADGELCRIYTIDEFRIIEQAASNWVFYNQAYCNHLHEYIRRCDSSEVESVFYGMALPEDLQINMTNVMKGASVDE